MNGQEDIYERLAAALEALPHGFARTPSGVEFELMKKAFTPEEVWLAGQLTRVPETATEIAVRVGGDVAERGENIRDDIDRQQNAERFDGPSG